MFVRKCDFISPLITLYYKGETRHSSIFSGLISILLIILVLYICIFISFDFLFKINPTSFYFITKIKDIGIIPLNQNYFFHYITFIDEGRKDDVFDDKLLSVIGMNNPSINLFLYNEISEYNFSHWKYERCKYLNKSNKDIIIGKYFNNSLCLSKYYDNENKKIINIEDDNFPYPSLQNNLEKEYFVNYGIIIKECENNTLYNNNSCYEKEISNKKKHDLNMKYIFNYFSNFIDVENYKHPIETQLNNITYNYNSLYINIHEINLHQTIVRTSDGILFDNKKLLKTNNIDSFFDENIINNYNKFIDLINIKMLNKAEIYHREYKKLQDIAGSVDGMIELVILIIEFINNYFYHDFRIVNDLNDVIGKKVKKLKLNQFKIDSSNISECKNINQVFNNNFISDNRLSSKFLGLPNLNLNLNPNPIHKISSMRLKHVKMGTDDFFPKLQTSYETKIVSNFQEISYYQFIVNHLICFKKKQGKYLEKILTLRKRILSEERLLKNYWKIKILDEGLLDIKIKSENQSLNSLNDMIQNKNK